MNQDVIMIDHALSLVMLWAFFISAVAGLTSVLMLLLQTRFRIDSTVIITKLELTSLYFLFSMERLTAAFAMLSNGAYAPHLFNACAKVALAGALVTSCAVMFKRLKIIREGLRK